jgi:CheY-like chemotaxis protein
VSKIVLCVDDSATMQQVADITFRGTEFQYVGARSVDEALSKAKAQKPAVVLADSAMPGGKSGYDLCLALKSEGATADVPVVILVGNSAPYDAAKGTQVGADANLPKPWDTQTMLEKVQEIVGKAASGVAKPGSGAAAAAPAAAAAKPAAAAAPAAPAAAAAAAAAAGNMPPRSATIMGMPTIKMPAGVAPTVGSATPPAAPNKTTAMAVPPMAPAAQMTTPGAGGAGLRPPASPASSAPAPAASIGPGIGGMNRSPMVAGNPTKRSALVERTLAKMAARLAEASGLEAGSPELAALLKLSTEVVERIVWEVVPELAEQIIKENLQELAASRRS